MNRKRYYYAIAAIGALVGASWVISAVLSSTSSTAAIGFLMIPPYAALFAGVACGFLHVVFTLLDIAYGKIKIISKSVLLSVLFLLALVFYSTGYYLKNRAVSIAANVQTTKPDLNKIHQSFLIWGRDDVEIKLAENPNSSEELLTTLSKSSNDYIVLQVGANPSTPLNILESIALGKLSYSRVAGLAANPNSSQLIIERLVSVQKNDFTADVEYSLYRTFVLAAVAKRENLPQNIFDKLADWPDHEYFLSTAILNSAQVSCPQIKKYQSEENTTLQALANDVFSKHNCL